MTADESELVGSILYITFKDTTENNVTITNVPKSISIVKQWADADTFGEEGMMQDIYLEVMMKYHEVYSTQWKTENLLEKSYFSLTNVICTPSSLTAELVQINGAPYLHVSGLAKADEPWRVTIRNLPGYASASFIIREVELAGYLNNLPNGKLELGFNEIGTITNTPTQLKITKQFRQAYFPTGSGSELPLNVSNTVVYLQIWREKRDGAGPSQHERYTPLLGALEANMDATLLSDGTVKLTVGTNTPTDAATLTLTRLPRYWFDKDTGASGEWYYYVKEVDAEGNEVHSASAPTNGERPEINLNVKTLTVTNTLTDVSARKVWTSLDNQFTLNPANLPDITLTLKQTTAETAADGDKIIANVTLGWDAEAGKVVAKNLDGWQFGEVVEYTAPEGSKNIWWGYKWYNLPAYDAGGNIYRYYVVEKTPVAQRLAAGDGRHERHEHRADSREQRKSRLPDYEHTHYLHAARDGWHRYTAVHGGRSAADGSGGIAAGAGNQTPEGRLLSSRQPPFRGSSIRIRGRKPLYKHGEENDGRRNEKSIAAIRQETSRRRQPR